MRPLLNNPCGIVAEPGVHWRGAKGFPIIGQPLDFPAGPWWSVRALARHLMALRRHGRRATPQAIADRFAPGWVSAICRDLNSAPLMPIDTGDPVVMRVLIPLIAQARTGEAIDDATLARGLDLAGIDVPDMQEAA